MRGSTSAVWRPHLGGVAPVAPCEDTPHSYRPCGGPHIMCFRRFHVHAAGGVPWKGRRERSLPSEEEPLAPNMEDVMAV